MKRALASSLFASLIISGCSHDEPEGQVAPVRVVAAPAPARTPIIIQDAPFSYNTDAERFTDSQPRIITPSRTVANAPRPLRRRVRRVRVPQWKIEDDKTFADEAARNAQPQPAPPVSRYQQMHQMIRELDQQINATNDIDHLERIVDNLKILRQDTIDAVNEGVMRRDGDGIQFAQDTSIKLEILIMKCQHKILRLQYPDSGQLRAQTQAAQAENDAMALNR